MKAPIHPSITQEEYSRRITGIIILAFTIGSILPALSVEAYAIIPYERSLFKALGASLIFFSFLSLWRTRDLTLGSMGAPLFIILCGIYLSLTISAMLWDFPHAITLFLRLVSAAMIAIFLLNLTKNELSLLLKYLILTGALLSILSIIEVWLGSARGEKIPILNVHTSKSLIFEQNVFGIYIYFCLLLTPYVTKTTEKRALIAILTPGLLLSFYRTVYALSALRIVMAFPKLSLAMLMSILFITPIDTNFLAEAMKADQISTLSGRDDLWRIGLDSFLDNPIFGSSEFSIPEVSNRELRRDPPFTTYHNIIVDLAAAGGIFSVLLYLIFSAACLILSKGIDRVTVALLFAPALFNSYIPFAPNPLGVMIGSAIVLLCRLNTEKAPS